MVTIKKSDISIIMMLSLLSFTIGYSYSQLSTSDYKDTISDTDLRKSFGYCPIDGDTENILVKYGVTYTIESCPLSRIYVDNWSELDDSTKQTIVIEFESKGYRMEKE